MAVRTAVMTAAMAPTNNDAVNTTSTPSERSADNEKTVQRTPTAKARAKIRGRAVASVHYVLEGYSPQSSVRVGSSRRVISGNHPMLRGEATRHANRSTTAIRVCMGEHCDLCTEGEATPNAFFTSRHTTEGLERAARRLPLNESLFGPRRYAIPAHRCGQRAHGKLPRFSLVNRDAPCTYTSCAVIHIRPACTRKDCMGSHATRSLCMHLPS